ncbi:sialidase family protein [Jiangella rhizosphaerae]|uniref:Exo-alpha-sialidase n=1 Tax=Jiangella rhizosphaerae TaxID=2293569 RepID=A0A418KGL4_9ACTN|nr:sialidase family protein [Jiangella rhizosphaerae]RIQ11156.1 exo-alpha-sialidase [Jiangella rhizosphaerae]
MVPTVIAASRRAVVLSGALVAVAALGLSAVPGSAAPAPAPPGTSSPTTAAAPVSSDATSVHLGSPREVIHTPNVDAGEVAWAPDVHAFDAGTAAVPTRPVHVTFGRHRDFRPWVEPGSKTSFDGGLNFTPAPQVPGIFTAVRRADGTVLDFSMTVAGGASNIVDADTRRAYTRVSTDGGVTFGAPAETMVELAPEVFSPGANLYPNNMVAAPDGTLYLGAYAVLPHSTGPSTSALLLESTDDGASWHLHSVIARGARGIGDHQFTETALEINVDGDLVAVMRNCLTIEPEPGAAPPCTYVPLQTARLDLDDPEATWTTPEPIDAPGFPSMIQPRLHLLPNGVMALLAGRQDTWITVSPDGTGASWEQPTLVYRNAALDQDGNPLPFPGTINEGSSGNSGMDWVASNRVVAAADTCHAVYAFNADTDKCNWRSHVYTMTDLDHQAIVRRPVDILTPGAGKLDLAGKVRARTASITVANEYRTPSRPRLGAQGAVDGSTEAWSSAAAAGGPGVYTIALDRQYRLEKVGLSQWIGHEQAATVEVATSPGGPWTTWWETGAQRSFALTYSSELPVVDARYVRVTTPGSDDCPEGMPAPCSMLNEIELYAADTQTFENDPLYTSPRDYERSETGVFTTDINTAGAGRVLRIADAVSDDRTAWVTKPGDPTSTKTLAFRFRPDQMGFDEGVDHDAFVFAISGRDGKKDVQPYRLAVFDDGSIGRWVAKSRAWQEIAPAGTVPGVTGMYERWSSLRVEATLTSATVSVSGTVVATAAPDGKVTALTSHTLACDPAPAVNSQTFFVDEVEFRP